MQNPKEQKTEQIQALNALSNLLSCINARDLRENLNQLFYGYLDSEKADSQLKRNQMSSTHNCMVTFLTKISNLPKIDSHDR